MFLRRLEIIGFRGINRLAMTLQPNMVLIGENAWGKTSLFDALSLVFNPDRPLYRFTQNDFHLTSENDEPKPIVMLFTFGEYFVGEHRESHCEPYKKLFVPSNDSYQQIYLRLYGSHSADGQIHTDYAFLDQEGREIQIADVRGLVQKLIQQFPIYAIRSQASKDKWIDFIEDDPRLCQHSHFDEIQAFSHLIQHYYFHRTQKREMRDLATLWEKVKKLCNALRAGDDQLKQRLFTLFSHLFMGNAQFVKTQGIHPIVLFEDPDAQLHPRLVAILWELISFLPLQRITTTNSVELLSQVELHEICRLERKSDEIKTYRLSRHSLSKQALRKLTFHIRYNRSLALFANTWILVEGETEVWLLSALAEQMGLNLEQEGIKVVEFAQCGLSPLIKYVKAMGIEWHVLTDGDTAGKKYADTVQSLLNDDETLLERLTFLPKRDIEHFLYFSGFDNVFVRLAHWQEQSEHRPASRIIQTAIKKSSKPDLAIALANEIEQRGKQSIPSLFRRMFDKLVRLS